MISKELSRLYFSLNLSDDTIVRSSEDGFSGRPFREFYDRFLSEQILDPMEPDYNYENLLKLLHTSGRDGYVFFTKDGTFALSFTMRRYGDDQNTVYADCERLDLTSSSNLSQYKDYLTGLYNRLYLTEQIKLVLDKKNGCLCAFVIIDLNHFKNINDTSGHRFGDEVLKSVSVKLRDICSGYLIGRYGGDEFILFIHDAAQEELKEVCKRIIELQMNFTFGDRSYTVTCCCGVALAREDEADYSTLFEMADTALYQAKEAGRNSAFLKNAPLVTRGEVKKISKKRSWKHSLPFRDELHRSTIVKIAISFFVVAAFVAGSVVTLVYTAREMREQADAETTALLTTISNQIIETTTNSIDSWFSQLTMAERMISDLDSGATQEEIDRLLYIINSEVSFDSTAIMLENGDLYFNRDSHYNIFSEIIAQKIILDRTSYVGNIHISGVGERVVFGLPYELVGDRNERLSIGGSKVSGIMGVLRTESFATLLNTNAFGNQTYVTLIEKDGSRVAASGNDELDSGVSNIYQTFEECLSDVVYRETVARVTAGETGLAEMTYRDMRLLLYYSPLDRVASASAASTDINNDWRIVIFTPYNLVLQNVKQAFYSLQVIMSAIVAAFACIVFGISATTTFYARKNKMLQFTDPLTGSINQERLAIDGLRTLASGKPYAIVYFNYLRFKYINERVGTTVSNSLIKDTYDFLQSRLEDDELISHIYADRYILVIRNNGREKVEERLKLICNHLIQRLSARYEVNETVSLGVYFTTGDDKDFNIICDRARIAQESIKGGYQAVNIGYFDEQMYIDEIEKMSIEQNAEFALKEGQFVVHYQPKWSLEKQCFIGSEALVRWNNPSSALVSPGIFIPIFEKNGFITKLDLYVFERVCQDMRKSINRGYKVMPVSVNLSRIHLLQPNFLNDFIAIREKYEIPAHLIEYELTESTVLSNAGTLKAVIEKIHHSGCLCSIDDFGSGYSSLNMLNNFQFDLVKLDRSLFYSTVGFNDRSRLVVNSIVALAHQLGMKVVAEGVESEEQIAYLSSIGCDAIQSFYFSKPLPYDQYVELLKRRRS